MKFRKKPVVIEALQYNGDNSEQVIAFTGMQAYLGTRADRGLLVPTLEGTHIASVGDWIIRGIKGEYYPCKPDIFEATYDAVLEEVPA